MLACANVHESTRVIAQAIPIRAAFKRAAIETGGASSWNRMGVETELTICFFKLLLSLWLLAVLFMFFRVDRGCCYQEYEAVR